MPENLPPALDQSVPGVTLKRLLGFGPTGSTWLGRDSDGAEVAVKRVRLLPDRLVRETARDALPAIAALHHPHLVPLLDGVLTHEGVALVSPFVAGRSLAAVTTRRGLTEGQLVTVTAPVLQALGALHAGGLVHGGVGLGDVLLDADGRPVLTDAAVAAVLGRGGTPEDDVRALCTMCLAVAAPPALGLDLDDAEATAPGLRVAGDAPLPQSGTDQPALGPVAQLLRAAADAPCPPSAVELAELVLATATAEPLPPPDAVPAVTAVPGARAPRPKGRRAGPELGRPQAGGQAELRAAQKPARPTRRLAFRRRELGLLSAVAAMAVAVLVGAAVSRGQTGRAVAATLAAPGTTAAPGATAAPATTAAPSQAASHVPWRAVLLDLDARRAAMLASPGDCGAVERLDVPGSAAARSDAAVCHRLSAAGWRARGFTNQLGTLTVQGVQGSEATIDVTDARSAYEVVGADGRVVQRVSARGTAAWRLRLVRTAAGGWRLASVVARSAS